jgi:hypothetical protein
VHLEASTKPHVHQKFEIFWINIASKMTCPNFKYGPKNGLRPLGVKHHKNSLSIFKVMPNVGTKKSTQIEFLRQTFSNVQILFIIH